MTDGDTKAIRYGSCLLIDRTPDAFVTEGVEITIMNSINSISIFALQVCLSTEIL